MLRIAVPLYWTKYCITAQYHYLLVQTKHRTCKKIYNISSFRRENTPLGDEVPSALAHNYHLIAFPNKNYNLREKKIQARNRIQSNPFTAYMYILVHAYKHIYRY